MLRQPAPLDPYTPEPGPGRGERAFATMYRVDQVTAIAVDRLLALFR